MKFCHDISYMPVMPQLLRDPYQRIWIIKVQGYTVCAYVQISYNSKSCLLTVGSLSSLMLAILSR